MEPLADAKSKHEQILEIVDQILTASSKLGITHIATEDERFDGRHITVGGKEMLNFGSCSYLGLELDERLIAGAVESVKRYGTQFSSSRAYVSVGLYTELEHLFEQMYGQPVILAPTVTLGHLANIPVLIGDEDAVVLDTQVHACVQTAAELLKGRNVHVETIRHSRLDILEDRIKKLSETYRKVWFFADGVYSMYGDFLPVRSLVKLLEQYDQFHLYVDDAHGMSWAGKNGTGFVMSQLDRFPEKLYLVTGLAKSFGTAGGLLVFPNEEERRLVKNCGKTLIFSGPIQPAVLGASIESAKIHLSDEIYDLQKQLQKKIKYFNQTAKLYDLPLISESNSPINFIGVGKPAVGYNMVRRMMNLGFYFNLSVFPSVSYKNTGLRIPINLHLTFEDIDGLLKNIAEQLPLALNDCESKIEEVYQAFKIEIPAK